MKKILITGATGWIGRHVLEVFKSQNQEIHAITSREPPTRDPLVHWHKIDLHHHGVTQQFIAKLKPTHLLHLAWFVEHGHFWSAPQNLIWVESSLNLVRAFAENRGKRLIATGSCAEYAWEKQDYKEEKASFRPTTLYGTCKRALHQILQTYCQQTSISFAWGYIFHLFGPGEYGCRFVPQVIASLLSAHSLPCSSGIQHRDFIYVKDLAQALVALLNSSIEGGVNLATGQPITLKEIALKIADKIGGHSLLQFGQVQSSKEEPSWIVANTDRLRDELEWKPSYSLEKALEETIDWWKSQTL